MKLYTTKELAETCGYANDSVIRKMIIDKKLGAKKYGNMWLISRKQAIKNKNILKRIKELGEK